MIMFLTKKKAHFELSLWISSKDTRSMATLLAKRVSRSVINQLDYYGRTLLHHAVQSNYYEGAKLLLEAGADVNQPNKHGYTAAQCLLQYSDTFNEPTLISRMLSLLTDAGATVNGATDEISPVVSKDMIRSLVPENTPFWLAANNDAPMLAAELAGGLDPNTKTENGMTLLHWACAGDAPECVQLLLDAGADVDAGRQPPIFHCIRDSPECLSKMIRGGADLNLHMFYGVSFMNRFYSPVRYALLTNSAEAVTALVGAGAKVSKQELGRNEHNMPHVALAILRNPVPLDALRALLAAAGARLLDDDVDGEPLLYYTVRRSSVDAVRVLVEAGADIHQKYRDHRNVLQFAERELKESRSDHFTARFKPIVEYLRSLPCFNEEQ